MPTPNRPYIGIAVVIIVVVVAYVLLNTPDRRSPTEKLGDAVHELGKGPDKAVRQLENRTPGEKVGDAVKDAGDKIKDSTSGK